MRKTLLLLLTLFVLPFALPAQATQTASLKWTMPSTTVPYAFRVYDIALASGQTTCPTFSTTTWKVALDSIGSSTPNASIPNLTAGVTYCFAVTAYNNMGSGGESGPSNLLVLPDPTSGGGNTGTPPSPNTLTGSRQ